MRAVVELPLILIIRKGLMHPTFWVEPKFWSHGFTPIELVLLGKPRTFTPTSLRTLSPGKWIYCFFFWLRSLEEPLGDQRVGTIRLQGWSPIIVKVLVAESWWRNDRVVVIMEEPDTAVRVKFM